MANICLSCKRNFHGTCRGVCDCTHDLTATITVTVSQDTSDDSPETDESGVRPRSRRSKPDNALKDQQSTGRKRAARLYPLDRSGLCEWAFSQAAGGGVTILGCGIREGTFPGLQQSRHHGPDYNTLNNDPGNVHRICHSCHNSWHAANDPTKDQRYLELYGMRAGGDNFKNSKVLSRDESDEYSSPQESEHSGSEETD